MMCEFKYLPILLQDAKAIFNILAIEAQEMTQDWVPDWSAAFKKGVKTMNDVQVGTVMGTTDSDVKIERGSRTMYTVPKTMVVGFDGNEILLSISDEDLTAYESRL